MEAVEAESAELPPSPRVVTVAVPPVWVKVLSVLTLLAEPVRPTCKFPEVNEPVPLRLKLLTLVPTVAVLTPMIMLPVNAPALRL